MFDPLGTLTSPASDTRRWVAARRRGAPRETDVTWFAPTTRGVAPHSMSPVPERRPEWPGPLRASASDFTAGYPRLGELDEVLIRSFRKSK